MTTTTKAARNREAGALVRLAFDSATPAEADRTIEVTACTSNINNHGARVDNASWQLDRYKANPVVLYGHADRADLFGNVRPSDTLPIGKASHVRVEGDTLKASITFATEEINPFAEQVYRAFAAGYLNAVSVGFLPHTVTFEIVNDQEIAVLSDCELFEISVVPLPADAGAVATRNTSSLVAFAASHRSIMSLRQQAVEAADPTIDKTAETASEADKPVEQAAPVLCPECGAECDPSFHFCPMCGESLGESPAEGPAEGEPAPASAPVEEPKKMMKAQSLRGLTGTHTRTQALGVIEGWRLAAQSVPVLQRRIEELEGVAKGDERKALIAKLSAEKKLTPAMRGWAQTVELGALQAFSSVASPITALTTKAVEAAPAASKAWESMSNMERHSLYVENREAFEALRAEYQRRQSAR